MAEPRGVSSTKSGAASSSKDRPTVVTEELTSEDRPIRSVKWAPSVQSESRSAASSSGADHASGSLPTETGTEAKKATASESLPTEAGERSRRAWAEAQEDVDPE